MSPNPRSCRSETELCTPGFVKHGGTWHYCRTCFPKGRLENFSLSIRVRVAEAGVGYLSGPSNTAKRLIVGSKPP